MGLTLHHYFLIQSLHFYREFENLIDYQMHDDYGAGSRHVSALAGIHYYACRPYYDKKVELFSPPEGNYYFVQKLANELDPTKLKTQHLVRSIKSIQSGFRVEVADLSTARQGGYGVGSSTAALFASGYNGTYQAETEEWSGTSNTTKTITTD